ncbi:hypothetical protein SNEBB_002709 [Seison nebaliae]|nr:hypothetical protein SNEBB_002709 [Seison nebaliae]
MLYIKRYFTDSESAALGGDGSFVNRNNNNMNGECEKNSENKSSMANVTSSVQNDYYGDIILEDDDDGSSDQHSGGSSEVVESDSHTYDLSSNSSNESGKKCLITSSIITPTTPTSVNGLPTINKPSNHLRVNDDVAYKRRLHQYKRLLIKRGIGGSIGNEMLMNRTHVNLKKEFDDNRSAIIPPTAACQLSTSSFQFGHDESSPNLFPFTINKNNNNNTSDTISIDTLNESNIVKSGILLKWTNYLLGWQERFFVLCNGTLAYYKSDSEMKYGCRGAVSLLTADILAHEFDTYRIDVQVKDSMWYLRASSENERNSWFQSLNQSRLNENEKVTKENDQTTVTRQGSLMSLTSMKSMQLRNNFECSSVLKMKLEETETFKDLLSQQLQALTTYFDACVHSTTNQFNIQSPINEEPYLPYFNGDELILKKDETDNMSNINHFEDNGDQLPTDDSPSSKSSKHILNDITSEPTDDPIQLEDNNNSNNNNNNHEENEGISNEIIPDPSLPSSTEMTDSEDDYDEDYTRQKISNKSSDMLMRDFQRIRYYSRQLQNQQTKELDTSTTFTKSDEPKLKSSKTFLESLTSFRPFFNDANKNESTKKSTGFDIKNPQEFSQLTQRLLTQHATLAKDFQRESSQFKVTASGVLANIGTCIEMMNEVNDRMNSANLKMKNDVERYKKLDHKYKRLETENRKLKNQLRRKDKISEEEKKIRTMEICGPDFEEGPFANMNDEFYDAVDYSLTKLEAEDERRSRGVSSLKQVKRVIDEDVNGDHVHRLSEVVEKVVGEHMRYGLVSIDEDNENTNNENVEGIHRIKWELIAEQENMKLYRREYEENGRVLDPLKAYYTVTGITGHEICDMFFDPTIRMEWESGLDSTRIVETLSPTTLLFHQVHKRVWPTAQRDTLFWSHIRSYTLDENSEIYRHNTVPQTSHDVNERIWQVCNCSTDHDDVKETNCVRVTLNVSLFCETIVPSDKKLSELTRNDIKCKITYIAQINPGGWAPITVLRQVSKREYPRFLNRFTQYVKEQCELKEIMF